MTTTESTKLIVNEKQIYKDTTVIAGYINKIVQYYNNGELPHDYYLQEKDSGEIFISDSFGGHIIFPDPLTDAEPASTYMKGNSYFYRNKEFYLPVRQGMEFYKADVHGERLRIPDITEFTEEYLFQSSLVKEEWQLNSEIFFSVLNSLNVPLFYTTHNALYVLLHNLRNRELI